MSAVGITLFQEDTLSEELDTVSYKVAVRKEDQDETVIKVEPSDFVVQEDMEETPGVMVDLEYCKAKLHMYDPEGYHALLAVWPHEAELVLYKRVSDGDDGEGAWEQVFAGAVTKVGTDDGEVTVAAHQKAEPVPA